MTPVTAILNQHGPHEGGLKHKANHTFFGCRTATLTDFTHNVLFVFLQQPIKAAKVG